MNLKRKRIVLLGATGSIGKNVINLVDRYPKLFKIVAVSANKNFKLLSDIIRKYKPLKACLSGVDYNNEIANIDKSCKVLFGKEKLLELVKVKADLIIIGISGFSGINSIFEALKTGTNIAIANKEPLVAAGNLFLKAVKKSRSKIIPIDSEHNAIFQMLQNFDIKNVSSITLTASGGPFWDDDLNEINKKKPEEALKHPNWVMGKKISIDSATMINKGLEIIEASVLFSLDSKKINVLVHPQSLVHGMINLLDGSIISYISEPDMRIPIFNALTWPKKINSFKKIPKLSKLNFMEVNSTKFPSISIARKAMKKGFIACNYFNASNEVAVSAYLRELISFTDIFEIVNSVTSSAKNGDPKSLDDVLRYDELAREISSNLIRKKLSKKY